MRRKDLRGAQVWMGAVLLINSLIVCRLSGRKMDRSLRLVMRRVFDGGVGCCSGGMLERSRLRDFFENLEEALEVREGTCGLMSSDVEAILCFGVCVCLVMQKLSERESCRGRELMSSVPTGDEDVDGWSGRGVLRWVV